jgi:hypothetical protein
VYKRQRGLGDVYKRQALGKVEYFVTPEYKATPEEAKALMKDHNVLTNIQKLAIELDQSVAKSGATGTIFNRKQAEAQQATRRLLLNELQRVKDSGSPRLKSVADIWIKSVPEVGTRTAGVLSGLGSVTGESVTPTSGTQTKQFLKDVTDRLGSFRSDNGIIMQKAGKQDTPTTPSGIKVLGAERENAKAVIRQMKSAGMSNEEIKKALSGGQ